MGFIEDKDALFGQISVVKGIEENFPAFKKGEETFQSVKSKKGNLIPMFMDLLKNLVDSSEMKKELNKFLVKADKIEQKIKDKIADKIIETYTKNFDFTLTAGTVFQTSILNIDLNDMLKPDPSTEMGKFYYTKVEFSGNTSQNLANKDFNQVLRDATQTGSASWGDLLDMTFTAETGTIQVSLNNSYSNKSFETFVWAMLNSVQLFKPSQLVTKIIDNMYGTVSSLGEFGLDWIENQVKLAKLVDKIIEKESFTTTTNVYENDFFTFNKAELDEISNKANAIYNGVNLADLGCGFGESFIDLNSFNDSFNKMNDSRPSLVKESMVSFTNNLIKQSTVDVSDENKKNVELNIISEIFKNLPSIFTNFALSPAIVTLFQMCESMVNGPALDFQANTLEGTRTGNFIQKLREPMSCIIKEIYAILIEFLYDRIKAEVIKLAKKLLAKILADQAENYIKILKIINEIKSRVESISELIGK